MKFLKIYKIKYLWENNAFRGSSKDIIHNKNDQLLVDQFCNGGGAHNKI